MMERHASLSLDLDNLWSYMKTYGNPKWQSFPTYLDIVVPRFLKLLDKHGIKITVFVVGQDAALEKNRAALRLIAENGHEIGNHSFHHEPWLHLYSPEEIEAEISRAEHEIRQATGERPRGFRGPGYSLSETVLRVLMARGYDYDCSTFPTVIGPLARSYYFVRSRLNREQQEKRKALFGNVRDGFRPNKPYLWDFGDQVLPEIPVTTMPFLKVPIHYSYLQFIAGSSEAAAHAYHAASLRACDAMGLGPSLLLHPLDFMGGDDVQELAFFPAMSESSVDKMRRMDLFLERLTRDRVVEPMSGHVDRLPLERLPRRRPDFPAEDQREGGSAHEEIAP